MQTDGFCAASVAAALGARSLTLPVICENHDGIFVRQETMIQKSCEARTIRTQVYGFAVIQFPFVFLFYISSRVFISIVYIARFTVNAAVATTTTSTTTVHQLGSLPVILSYNRHSNVFMLPAK